MILEPTTGGISTETHNMRDSSGEIYGIAGQLFLLPIIGFLLGITIGVICGFGLDSYRLGVEAFFRETIER